MVIARRAAWWVVMSLVPALSSCAGCGPQSTSEDEHPGVGVTPGNDGGMVNTDGGRSDEDGGGGFCGDGDTGPDEECDDANDVDTDECHNNCTSACGDGVVAAFERCDTALAAGTAGACPTQCTNGAACTVGSLQGAGCLVECVYQPVSACQDGDGCCGFGCNAATDPECTATCGNGVVETGETCDPQGSCPTTCDDNDACTLDDSTGQIAMCNLLCTHSDITACADDDGCCPASCSPASDNDCVSVCGNGQVEPGESCDPPGTCPTACNDMDPCTTDALTGTANNCDAQCVFTPVVQTVAGDFCCPSGANANTDPDCMPDCGNGAVEMGEVCDGNCPTQCNDMLPCTTDILMGSAATCDAVCTTVAVTACTNADQCCPAGCNAGSDNDCSAGCGDGMVDPGETCDPPASCPTSCTAPDACSTAVLQGSAANCNAECVVSPITACSLASDGCCPGTCNANTDADCSPVCPNGVIEPPELCDGTCPTACADMDACTTDTLTGSAATCDAQCTFAPITACVAAPDGCCAPGCTTANDGDCVGTPNAASAVTTTATCLVAGTSARVAVVLTLTDSGGLPINSANVSVTTTAGTMGPVTATGSQYVAVLTVGATPGSATVTVVANGVTMTTQPVVTFAPPFTELTGGGGGCNISGNLRVRVVDTAGAPLAGAYVMVGAQQNLSAFSAQYGAAPSLPNTAQTNASGYVSFLDLGGALAGPQTVTAGQSGRRYQTFVAMNAADMVLVLDVVSPMPSTGTYSGDFTNVTAPRNSPIEFGLMLPDTTLNKLANLDLDGLLGTSQCYSAGGALGDIALPSNVFVPQQCAASIFICLQQLPRHAYTSPAMPYGARKLVGLYGDAPLSALTGAGGIIGALPQITIRSIGLIDRVVSAPGPTLSDIDMGQAVAMDVGCNLGNLPPVADVFCATAVDYDSGASATLSPGEGRLGLTGFKVATITGAASTANITGVGRAPRTSGPFVGSEYVGVVVARYLDNSRTGIPAGTAEGTTAVMVRNNPFGNNGGTMAVADLFPIRTQTQNGRAMSLSAVPAAPNPAADMVIQTLTHVIISNYTTCAPNDSTQTTDEVLWEVMAPGGTSAVTLPTLPAGWPRAGAAGNFSGLVDPAATVYADRMEWRALTVHLGLRTSAFDWNRLQLDEYLPGLTHISSNTRTWQ